jgi:hypothetical protein
MAAASDTDDFHLYLMAEPAHKIIAKLEAIGTDAILDSAPDAFHAEWSADSRHVAVLFRSDRHVCRPAGATRAERIERTSIGNPSRVRRYAPLRYGSGLTGADALRISK